MRVRERQSREQRASPNFPLNLRHTRAAERPGTCLEFNSASTRFMIRRTRVNGGGGVIHPDFVEICDACSISLP